jgi:hypothetical protein
MTTERPMPAAEIREALGEALQSGGLWIEAIGSAVLRILDNIEARERRDAELVEMKLQIGEMGQRRTNEEGPPGTYGCRCTSRNALECAQQAYYAGVEARERCGCLCHQWATDDAERAADRGNA